MLLYFIILYIYMYKDLQKKLYVLNLTRFSSGSTVNRSNPD